MGSNLFLWMPLYLWIPIATFLIAAPYWLWNITFGQAAKDRRERRDERPSRFEDLGESERDQHLAFVASNWTTAPERSYAIALGEQLLSGGWTDGMASVPVPAEIDAADAALMRHELKEWFLHDLHRRAPGNGRFTDEHTTSCPTCGKEYRDHVEPECPRCARDARMRADRARRTLYNE